MPDVIAPEHHPEFGWSVPARVADSSLALVRDDDDLAAYFTEITDFEIEDLLLEANHSTPLLAQVLTGMLRQPSGSGRQGRDEIEIEWFFVWGPAATPRGTQQRLKARVIDRFCTLLAENKSVVFEPDTGKQLTMGLLGIRRIPAPVRIPAANNALATRVITVHTSTINLETGELYDE